MKSVLLPLLFWSVSVVGHVAQAAEGQVASKEESRAAELDRLFGKLQKNSNKAESQIYDLWLQSGSPTADVLLGQSIKAIRAKSYDAAQSILDLSIQTYPDHAEAYNKRAALYYAKGENDKALVDLGKVLDLEPRHFGALIGRGLILEDMGKSDLALQAYRDALVINPTLEHVKAVVKLLERASPNI